eukprot:Mycagemm_TRINITY_DN10098_c1_g1::TRINITY_DN10098_c1_g1_i1::g.2288::m.2288 type:complete len:390 gc:universal TRINITY_DN10098_c1_g1_i1:193-1362(+)
MENLTARKRPCEDGASDVGEKKAAVGGEEKEEEEEDEDDDGDFSKAELQELQVYSVSTQELLAKISALHKVNSEIVARIEAAGESLVEKAHRYHVSLAPFNGSVQRASSTFAYAVQEVQTVAPASHWATAWLVPANHGISRVIGPVKDNFVNYNVKTFAALKKLNNDMLRLCNRYRIAREAVACVRWREILDRLEKIQVGLGQVEDFITTRASKLEQLKSALDKVNESVRALFAAVEDDQDLEHQRVFFLVAPPPDCFEQARCRGVQIRGYGCSLRVNNAQGGVGIGGYVIRGPRRVVWRIKGNFERIGVCPADTTLDKLPDIKGISLASADETELVLEGNNVCAYRNGLRVACTSISSGSSDAHRFYVVLGSYSGHELTMLSTQFYNS